jgi:hypothetical protein
MKPIKLVWEKLRTYARTRSTYEDMGGGIDGWCGYLPHIVN